MNQLDNATGLDGGVGWSTPNVAVQADETVRGSPGRVCLVGGAYILSGAIPLNGAASILAFAHHAKDSILVVRWLNGQGADAGDVVIPRLDNPAGPARRGIPSTFAFSRARVQAPVGAAAYRLFAQGTAESLLLKPYASPENACAWSPGPHSNLDLNLKVWPEALAAKSDSWRASPTGVRVGFETDSRIPITTQVASEPWVLASFSMALDLAQRDDLETFWRSTKGAPFWYVRPDTHQLCRAWWTEDGDPSDSGMGRGRRTEVGLLLEPT